MKVSLNKKHKKYLLAITASLFILIVGFITYINFIDSSSKPIKDSGLTGNGKIDYSEPSAAEITESARNKNEIIDNMDKPQNTPETSDKPISLSITRANRNLVSVYIEKISEGTCYLSVTQSNQEKISMSSKVIAESAYSTCEGFSIDSTKLDNSPYKVTVNVTSGNRKGSASQENKD